MTQSKAAGNVSKLRGICDITEPAYGAATTASGTVNSAALQAALNAHAFAFVPEGTFNIATQIAPNSNNGICGPGTLQATAALVATVVILANGKTNIDISGIEILGAVGNLPVALIQLKTCTKSKVHDTRLRYASHEGVSLNQSTYDCSVYNNLIRDISSVTGWGIGLFWDILRCKVFGNTILDCGAYGIVMDDGTAGQVDNLPCIGNVVHDNIIYTATTGMWGIAVEGCYDCDVHDNYIQIVSTIGIDIAESNCVTKFYPLRNDIHHNIIRNDSTTATQGIRLLGGSNNTIRSNKITAGDLGIKVDTALVEPMLNNIIEDNEIYECTAAGATNKTGIQVATSVVEGLRIKRNNINSPGFYGIHIQAGANIETDDNVITSPGKEAILHIAGTKGQTIIGNRILNASASSATTYPAIRVQPGSGVLDRCVVTRNIIDDTQASATCTLGVDIVGGGGTFSRCQVYDNLCLKSTIVPLKLFSVAGGVYGSIVPQTVASAAGIITPSTIQDNDILDVTLTEAVTAFNLPSSTLPDGGRFTVRFTQGGAGGYNVAFAAGYTHSWSDTGNTVGKVATVTFINQAGAMIQQSFSAYM